MKLSKTIDIVMMPNTDEYSLEGLKDFILKQFLWLTCFTSLIATILVCFMGLDPTSKLAAVAISMSLTVFLFIFQYLLTKKHMYTVAGYGSIASIIAAVIGGIFMSGGVTYAPSAPLLAIPCLMAFFFLGRTSGVLVTSFCILLVIAILIIEGMGVKIPQTMGDHEGAVHVLCFFVGFCAICGITYIYEFTTRSLNDQLQFEHQQAVRLSRMDTLTEIPNRRAFNESLQYHLDELNRGRGKPFLLIFFDLNGFKPINDQYGHDAGDDVLKIISQRISNSLRKTDTIGRHGGDEFMLIICPEKLDASSVEAAALRIHGIISQPITLRDSQTVNVSASLGIAACPKHGKTPSELIKAADSAMYIAKNKTMHWYEYSPNADSETEQE